MSNFIGACYGNEIICAAVVIAILLLFMLWQRLRLPPGGELEKAIRAEMREAREEASRNARDLREEVAGMQAKSSEAQQREATQILQNIQVLSDRLKLEMASEREQISRQMSEMRQTNEKKLEEIRQTVDEKLHSTLEKRLGASFKLVSERLEAVQRGLGEMQTLATGVGDLKRVFSNVKERGTWGEYQLGAILAEILTPDQYAQNVRTREGSGFVEFAVKLPGHRADHDHPVWLPIDAKFPKEAYERLGEASRAADRERVQAASDELRRAIAKMAKEINEKYINPPNSTDFAILFLPTEGLYAEVLRQPGLHDELQRECRVIVAGPTTLAAILNSLRVGFQTLAIERRASEVWQVLGAVKTEFGKFGAVLDKVKRQITTVSNTLDESSRRTRVMERRLRDVAQLPAGTADNILEFDNDEEDEEEVKAGEEQEGVIHNSGCAPGAR